jgi:hypothetical protein
MPISAISQEWEVNPAPYKSVFSSGKYGEIIGHSCEWAFCYPFLAEGAPWIWISHISDLKSKFTLNVKIRYRQFNVK